MQLNLKPKKELSRNEINFRAYMKKYHPEKYEQIIWQDARDRKIVYPEPKPLYYKKSHKINLEV